MKKLENKANWEDVKKNHYALLACIVNTKLNVDASLNRFKLSATSKDYRLKDELKKEQKFEIEYI